MRRSFLVRRTVMLLASLLLASFVIFTAIYLAPGNPLSALVGGRTIPAASMRVLEQRYHLDAPFLEQYAYWLGNAVHGDLGTSISLRENVSTLIASGARTTGGLVAYSSVLILVFGIGMGALAALRPGAIDTGVLTVSAVTAALPAFMASIVLIQVFSVSLGWFPAGGGGTGFGDALLHLTLPAVALAISSVAIVARITRASVREEAGREHVQTAISRGIHGTRLIRRHILRNAAIPITTVSGITIASLIAVDAVVEVAFGLHGLGSYLIQAAQTKDLAVVQGISLVLVAAFVAINVLVDVLYAVLDPRVTLGSRAR